MENFYLKDISLLNYRKFEQSTFQLNRYMNGKGRWSVRRESW